jgi:excisionase family DNA binding protein
MTSQRLTVREAAEVLGTSVDAVRMRVRRGSLASEKDPDGRVLVLVDGESSETKPRPDGESEALIFAKDETIAVLREQLEAEREAHREARRIIAGLVQRLPELEAPPEAPVTSQTASEGAEPRSGTGGAHEGASRPPDTAEWPVRGTLLRPWWRRVFGG